jgi:release factor glutamine methyltransferase
LNILELYQAGINELTKNKIETPKIDARAILEHILGIDFGKLSLYYNNDAQNIENEYLNKIKLRCENMPLSYITNKKEFFSLPFYVCQGALIPRAETENLVQAALDNAECRMQNALKQPLAVADVCSGSGCIGISIALKKPLAVVDLYELSDEAIRISKINKENLGAKNVAIIKKDILNDNLDRRYDIIVSNPPYIPKDEIPTLMSEVRDYEPQMALTDGEDGNLFYKRLAELTKLHLNKGGILAVEVGINQHNIVKNIFIDILGENGKINIIKDYFGIERVLIYEAN